MKRYQDAYGHELYDYLLGFPGHEIVKRDDGCFSINPEAPGIYFSEYENWAPNEKRRYGLPGDGCLISAAVRAE